MYQFGLYLQTFNYKRAWHKRNLYKDDANNFLGLKVTNFHKISKNQPISLNYVGNKTILF